MNTTKPTYLPRSWWRTVAREYASGGDRFYPLYPLCLCNSPTFRIIWNSPHNDYLKTLAQRFLNEHVDEYTDTVVGYIVLFRSGQCNPAKIRQHFLRWAIRSTANRTTTPV
jgi:hypothetical protein